MTFVEVWRKNKKDKWKSLNGDEFEDYEVDDIGPGTAYARWYEGDSEAFKEEKPNYPTPPRTR